MMNRRVTAGFIGIALTLAACSDPTTPPTPTARSMSAATFPTQPATIAWQARARALVSAASMSPLAAGRVYAALGVAQYEAITAANSAFAEDGTLKSNGIGAGGRSLLELQRGAVAGASARVLGFFFASAAAALDAQVLAEANAGPGGVHPQFSRGLAIGQAAGSDEVQFLQNDQFTVPWSGTVPVGPGLWVANGTPAGGTLGNVTPRFLSSSSQFRPAPPPSYLSAEFSTALDEVLTFALNRTPAQTAFIVFWNSGPGTPTPPGYWNAVAGAYSAEAGLDEAATAHVFALTGAAVFDAQIACWDAKYYYWFIRPSQANAGISLAIPLPNHPSYPSGHSCVSAAAAAVLAHFFPQHASDIADDVANAGLSRIIAGIHYRFDITAGNAIGRAVGELALASDL